MKNTKKINEFGFQCGGHLEKMVRAFADKNKITISEMCRDGLRMYLLTHNK